MGPLSNWGKKSIVISGGNQYTLEDLTEAGWEKMGKMKEVKSALNQAADARKKLFKKDMNFLHMKWMETKGGEVIRVGDEDIKENGAIFAQAFSMGVAVQELDETVNKITVVREESEEEIRDAVYVGGAPAPSKIVFLTPRKPKGKERARDVSPSPAPKRKGHPQNGLSLETLQEGLNEAWVVEKKGKGEAPDSVTSWGSGTEFEDPSLDATVLGFATLDPPVDQVREQEWTEHHGLDSQGFRTVRNFTGPPLPQIDLGYNWEKGDEVAPPTPDTSQAVPLFASIEAA